MTGRETPGDDKDCGDVIQPERKGGSVSCCLCRRNATSKINLFSFFSRRFLATQFCCLELEILFFVVSFFFETSIDFLANISCSFVLSRCNLGLRSCNFQNSIGKHQKNRCKKITGYLEPQTTIYKWLFQLYDSKSLHRKWLFHQTSIYIWLFGVPGIFLCHASQIRRAWREKVWKFVEVVGRQRS